MDPLRCVDSESECIKCRSFVFESWKEDGESCTVDSVNACAGSAGS